MILSKSRLNDLADPKKFHEPINISSRFPTDYYIEALKDMVLIRKVEQEIGQMVEDELVNCPCHLTIGQEAIPVGLSRFLNKDDFIFGTHRSHGHYLALGGDVYQLFAEVLGKIDGCSKGMGGSQHLTAREKGFIGSVPIVATTIPIAVGCALASKMRGNNTVSVTYFGDGAMEEGGSHESLNIASKHKLPVIFVCENNLFASHMQILQRQPSDSVVRFANAHNIECEIVDGNDITTMFSVAEKAIEYARSGRGPFFIEAVTYRWRGHVGPDPNTDVGLKRSKDLPLWRKRDPIDRLYKSLLANKLFSKQQYLSYNHEIEKMITNYKVKAINAEYPPKSQLLSTVYY
ncbi:dehydrogenase, partial [bacterium I07]